MDMQVVPVPLFDQNMAVEAYLLRYQRGNTLFALNQLTSLLDGGSNSPLLDMLNLVGTDTFTLGKPIIVPIKNVMLVGDLEKQYTGDPEKVIFLTEETFPAKEPYLGRMKALKQLGFRFAFSSLEQLRACPAALSVLSYIFIGQHSREAVGAQKTMHKLKRASSSDIRFVASNVDEKAVFTSLLGTEYALFEGAFFRTPVSQGKKEINPMKMNSISLINMVQDPNFEFDEIARIVQRDTALTISLLRLVNSAGMGLRNEIKTISHAVTMLGQKEVRKWVTTAVAQMLGADKPDELTKLSLIRARFSENLAPYFKAERDDGTPFLMGLFSVIDLILEMPMAQAFESVLVPDVVKKALVEKQGPLAPIYSMISDYEAADWSAVSRHMIVSGIRDEDLYNAYIDSLTWYSSTMSEVFSQKAESGGEK
ncbi:HDOD domain-containing protein [Oscillospiraceae bacterium OttesenSCG-928-F05]|nr:HDOD domain-containing protein [Oscillospiraceae bacterium OttesenSCG-928-F05]